MKILFVIPHYYYPENRGKYGSTRNISTARIEALGSCISFLYQIFGQKQYMLDISSKSAVPINQEYEIKIIIMTTQHRHLLKDLNINPRFYTHREVETEPMMLGFEAKKVFEENFEQYDYYCYLEDDLIINDPWFFNKLKWFNKLTGDNYLLQPNRYEISSGNIANKVYVDGNLRPQATEKFQNINDSKKLTAIVMGEKILLTRTLNPHSGCYFLNRNQLEIWVKQNYFRENNIDFIGPLESAATLGIMKTFKVYKSDCPDFFEILHYGTSFLSMVGSKVKIAGRTVLR